MSLRSSVVCVAAFSVFSCHGEAPKSRAQIEMSLQEVEATMAALAQPGPKHLALSPMAGKWNVVSKMTTSPGAAPSMGSGTMNITWALGGRFLEERFVGEMAGRPFEGRGFLGYDNALAAYQGFWIDNMGTMMMPVAQGRASPDQKVFTLERIMIDPVTDQEVRVREVTTLKSPAEVSLQIFHRPKGMDEYLLVDIAMTRVE